MSLEEIINGFADKLATQLNIIPKLVEFSTN